jgi:hypothetical protein
MSDECDQEGLTIELLGKICAKKNRKFTFRGKDGKMKASYGKAQDELDRLEIQIPGWARGLELVSPDLDFQFECPNKNWDRDNAVTTAIDLLVKTGVLKNDSVKQLNSIITIFPARMAEYWKTTITIWPTPEDQERI